MKDDTGLRRHLMKLLGWQDAHVGFDAVVKLLREASKSPLLHGSPSVSIDERVAE